MAHQDRPHDCFRGFAYPRSTGRPTPLCFAHRLAIFHHDLEGEETLLKTARQLIWLLASGLGTNFIFKVTSVAAFDLASKQTTPELSGPSRLLHANRCSGVCNDTSVVDSNFCPWISPRQRYRFSPTWRTSFSAVMNFGKSRT